MTNVGYTRAVFQGSKKAWGLAISEIFIVSGISLIPLLAAAIRELFPPDSEIYLSDALVKSVFGGQLIFYAMGIIAMIVWNSNRDFKYFFSWRVWINVYCIFCVVICSLVVGYDPTLNSIDKHFLGKFSAVIFVVSLLVYALISVVSQVQINVGRSLSEDDDELLRRVRKSRSHS